MQFWLLISKGFTVLWVSIPHIFQDLCFWSVTVDICLHLMHFIAEFVSEVSYNEP